MFLLAFAVLVRLWRIDLTEFDVDQTNLLLNAEAFVTSGQVPQTGGASFTIGIRIPPLLTFLYALPMLVSRDPVWISAFQGLVDALTVMFLFLVGRELAGRWAGLAMGVVYACLPAAVLYGRLIWPQDFVPFFTSVALWGGVTFLRRGDSRHLAAAVFALLCAVQLHPTAAAFFPALAAVAFLRWRDLRWPPFAVAAALQLALLAPYLWLQVTTGWSDLFAVASYLSAPKHFAADAGYLALSLVGGDFHRQVTTRTLTFDWSLAREPLLWVTVVLLSLGCAAALRIRGGWLLVFWLGLPVLAALRASDAPVHPHYLLGILPIAAALVGLGLSALRPAPLGALALVLLTGVRLADGWAFEGAVAATEVPAYGVPLRYFAEAAHLAEQLNSDDRLFIAQPPSALGLESGIMFGYLTGGRFALARYTQDHTFVIPPRGGFYLSYAPGQSAEPLEGFGPPLATVAATNGKPIFQLFRVTPVAAQRYLDGLALPPLDFDVGHALRVWGLDHARLSGGAPSAARLGWEVTATDRVGELRLFGHLVDPSGRSWSTNPDTDVYPLRDWRVGDRVISWLPLDPPAATPTGGYWLDVGFYERFGLRPLPVYERGAEIGNRFRVGPLKVSGPPLPSTGRTQAVFGSAEIALEQVQRDGPRVTLTWRADRAPTAAYTVFIHLLDAQGNTVAQHDGPPVGGIYPTTLWEAGDVVADVHTLEGDLSRGEALAVGLYDSASLARLPVRDSGGQPLGDRYLVPFSQVPGP